MPGLLLAVLLLCAMATTAIAQMSCPIVNESYGFYGPNSAQATASMAVSTQGICIPKIQPVNDVCVQCRLAAIPVCNCPQGYSCDLGDAYPQCVICPPGYFCPRNGGARPQLCPEGYYCPQGSWFPLECDALSLCPAGSSRYISLSVIAVAVLTLLCVAALALYHWIATRTPSRRPAADVANGGDESRAVVVARSAPSISAKSQGCANPTGAEGLAGPTAIDIGSGSQAALEPRTGWAKHVSFYYLALPLLHLMMAEACLKAVPLDVRFENICVEVPLGIGKGKRTIMHDVSGRIRPGCMTAIIGPSGAGKTTILNVLRGRMDKTAGRLWINDEETQMTRYKKLVGVVPQDDIMHRDLTVHEILCHSAHTRLPRSWPAKTKLAVVDEVLQELGLDEVRHRVVGDELRRGLSGGQRKRVNIGIELVGLCTLLLLDEPTSGLDSTAAEDCMLIMRRIAQKGIAVAAVVHQPRDEIWRLFDTVLVLATGGRTVYFGPRAGAAPFFEALGYARPEWVSEPDFILDAVSGALERQGGQQRPEDLAAAWVEYERAAQDTTAALSEADLFPPRGAPADRHWSLRRILRKAAKGVWSFAVGTSLYALQSAQQTSHTLRTLMVNCLLFAFTGLYIGVCFFRPKYRLPLASQLSVDCPTPILQIYQGLAMDTEGDPNAINVRNWCSTCTPAADQLGQMAFYVGMGVGVIAAASSIDTFGGVRKVVYWREASAGANRLAYFVGRDLVDVLKSALFALCFTSVFMLLAAPLGSFATYFCLVLAQIYCVYGIGYAASVPLSFMNANMLAAILVIVLMITSGFVFRTQKLGAIGAVSHPRWFGEAMFAAETNALGDATFETLAPGNDTVGIRSYSLQDSIAIYADARYGYATDRLGFDILMMFICGVALRGLAMLLLIVVRRDQQR